MTWKQFATLDEREYFKTYKDLNAEQRKDFHQLSDEIHLIWNYINSNPIMNVLENDGISCIEDYHTKVAVVDPRILLVARDFGLTLKIDRNAIAPVPRGL